MQPQTYFNALLFVCIVGLAPLFTGCLVGMWLGARRERGRSRPSPQPAGLASPPAAPRA